MFFFNQIWPFFWVQVFCNIWQLGCNSVDDSSENSTFCHFSTFHPHTKLWALANATQFFFFLFSSVLLLFLWALSQIWRKLCNRVFWWGAIDRKTTVWEDCLLLWVYLTCACHECHRFLQIIFLSSPLSLDTLKILRLLMISMFAESLAWGYGVLGFILYTPGKVLITLFVTGEALICNRWIVLRHDKGFVPAIINVTLD